MKVLNDKIVKELGEVFKNLDKKVSLKFFTQDKECIFCRETHQLLSEVASVNDKIQLEIFDFVKDKPEAEKLGVDKIPATVVMDETDYGIRFYGIPGGYEFASLIEAIKMVSSGKTDLQEQTVNFLRTLEKDVHLQVFVTPTCPYCPNAVILAHQMAYVSPKIKGDMVEATEFPHLSQKFSVMGVPKTIINNSESQEGAAPETLIIEKIKKAL